MCFWKKPHSQWHASDKTTPSNPFLHFQSTRNQVFKHEPMRAVLNQITTRNNLPVPTLLKKMPVPSNHTCLQILTAFSFLSDRMLAGAVLHTSCANNCRCWGLNNASPCHAQKTVFIKLHPSTSSYILFLRGNDIVLLFSAEHLCVQ